MATWSALRASRLRRRGRTPGLRTTKSTVAAVAAFVIARALETSSAPILAPLTALLVVRLTLYETVKNGIGRIASVLAGVLVAVGVASFVGLTWWSLGVVVAVSLVLGRLLRLGDQLLEVPITAMLILAVGGDQIQALGRVSETLIGALVGIAVNLLITPPLYVQSAGDAMGELAEEMVRFLRDLGGALRAPWSREAADRWLDAARALGGEVDRADQALARAEQSARLHPRAAQTRAAQPRLRTGLTGLERVYVSLRSICRALLDRTFFVPEDEQATAFSVEVRAALADVLVSAASAVEEIATVLSADGAVERARSVVVEARIPDLRRRRDRLAALLLVVPSDDPATWEQHGALLAAVDHLRTEAEAAVRPAEAAWRPPPLVGHPGQAVRRVVRSRGGRRGHRGR